jgi:type IV pilus assembly protein PilP
VNIKSITKTALVIWFVIVFTGWHTSVVYSAEEAKPAEEEKELKFTEKMAAILFEEPKDAFFYKREGRADPFVPFIQERVVATQVPIEELTGMRKFEPGQLTVVAIVMAHDDRFAMVQTANNQGYIIREGILLGRTGVVEAISPNKVAVKNYTYNLAGDKIYKTVEMLLKKEGEK